MVFGCQWFCVTTYRPSGFEQTLPALLDGHFNGDDRLLFTPLLELLPLSLHRGLLDGLLDFLSVINPHLPSLAESL